MFQQDDELLSCVDAEGREIRSVPRRMCHCDPAQTHRVVHVLVQDQKGRLLAQRRSATKDIQPGRWDTAVGGHLLPSEDPHSGALREYREELGHLPDHLEFLHEYTWISDLESERVTTYLARDQGPFEFDRLEIDELRFFSDRELIMMDADGVLTPNFRYELRRFVDRECYETDQTGHYPAREIVTCRGCRRLVQYRKELASKPGRSLVSYWNRPVPGFGDMGGRILIVGLAPGLHGANRTGRVFTGDTSGDLLWKVLHSIGMSDRNAGICRGDGLMLRNVFVTNAVKCVPPGNRPLREELTRCRKHLFNEIRSLYRIKAVLALGRTAFESIRYLLADINPGISGRDLVFSAGSIFRIRAPDWTVGAVYHPSRRNQNTGLIDENILRKVLENLIQTIV